MKLTFEDNACLAEDRLNVRRVAEYLQCCPRTVYRYVQECLLPPPMKIGGHSFWPLSDITAYLAKQEKKRHRKS